MNIVHYTSASDSGLRDRDRACNISEGHSIAVHYCAIISDVIQCQSEYGKLVPQTKGSTRIIDLRKVYIRKCVHTYM